MLTKREVFENLLQDGIVDVMFETQRRDVVLPPVVRNVPVCNLQFGLDMAVPIPDLAIDEDAIRATLSFDRTPFHCTVPWAAIGIIGLADGTQTVMWACPDEAGAETPAPKPALTLVRS